MCKNLILLNVSKEKRKSASLLLAGRRGSIDRRPLSAKQRAMDQVQAGASKLIGETEVMQRVRMLVERAAESPATVLIRGESGTGKGVIAREIHRLSARGRNRFVRIDCTLLSDTLARSELFGHVKGAYTGADTKKTGLVKMADQGTAFVDEIGDIAPAVQGQLLRLLQEGDFEPLGSVETEHVDVRFILATHCDLETMIKQGKFRADLYYRMKIVELWLPPLRARRCDIELLAKHFLRIYAQKYSKPELEFSPETLKFLKSQRWPGNVRELENVVSGLVATSTGSSIELEHFSGDLLKKPTFRTETADGVAASATTTGPCPATGSIEDTPASVDERTAPASLSDALAAAEKAALAEALRSANGDRKRAEELLDIGRATLYKLLKKHNLK